MKEKNNTSENSIQKSFNSLKNYKFTIDTELEADDEKILFPEKLRKANETIKKVGLPKEVQEELDRRKKETKEK
ncbi:MAG: hypothetical protein COZ18_10365 [Flexibacter sp. CG_4_10_14_3_um_filter_32_15]|nr:MAG: hypothetical protein COZ18_10365 [Flexibacter sp. CG_4_10_14_3_um_filter_32_15]